MTALEIVRFIQSRRLPLNDEKAAQAALESEFRSAGVSSEREVRLSDTDIVDFMVGGVAVEMKIKAPRLAVYRQCVRYCMHDRVTELVLATNTAMGMPDLINGKPILIASLGRAWL